MKKIILFIGMFGLGVYGANAIHSVKAIYQQINTLYFDEVSIGTQIWMRKNLNVDRFRNGDAIPEARTVEEWQTYTQSAIPAWCYYGNNPGNGETYGKLYNWYAVNDPRGLAPEGWHIPSDSEWIVLTKFLGGSEKAGTKMKSSVGWYNNANGNNASGFLGLASGCRDFDGAFTGLGCRGEWWSTGNGPLWSIMLRKRKDVWLRSLSCYNDRLVKNLNFEGCGVSVRCVRD